MGIKSFFMVRAADLSKRFVSVEKEGDRAADAAAPARTRYNSPQFGSRPSTAGTELLYR
jgi:hypothetical protein